MKGIFRRSILKQYLLILSCLLTLTLALSAVGYGYLYRLMTKNAATYAQDTARRFDAEIQYTIRRADSIFVNLLFDPSIEQFLLAPYSRETPRYINSLQVQFSSYSIMNEDIADIALASPEMCWSNYFDAATLRGFCAQMEASYGVKCLGLHASPLTAFKKSGEVRLVFARNMYGMHNNTSYGRFLGTIFLSLDLRKSPITLPTDGALGTYFILASSNGASFSFNCPPEQCADILSHWDGADMAAGSAQQDIPGYRVYATRIEGTDLFILSALDRSVLTQDVNRTMTVFLAVAAAVFLLLALLMLFLLKSMVTPLQKLDDHIVRIKNSAPAAPKEPLALDGCEEVRNLNRSFHELLERQAQLSQELHETTVTLYETELGKKQAELDFLRSQINPHFLYNALESINALAAERGVAEISDAVGALGKLFRYNVKGAATVPLRQELETVRAYLTVQRLRFADKLNVITSARENALDAPVMKLLVQPLVENAVHHGIEPKDGAGTLYIGARLEGGRLLVSVYDDGVGIPAPELARLQARLAAPPAGGAAGEHIGLMNVACRVRLRYGPQYGLRIESGPEGGTRQILTLPAAPDAPGQKEETVC